MGGHLPPVYRRADLANFSGNALLGHSRKLVRIHPRDLKWLRSPDVKVIRELRENREVGTRVVG